jgi:tRNA pseudouridine55 synthase
MFGILLIDKPLGGTSHDVVNHIRRKFGTRRVGHAGTLDPLGTGLLVVAVGPATRFLQYLPLEPKEYVSEITFGRATDTYDAEGETTEEHPVPDDLPRLFGDAAEKLLGLIEQVPPIYSAVKVNGKPLYKYARAGQEVERISRRVHIGALDVLSIEENRVRVRVECSGGTYVRTLAHDLGQMLGCGAFLSALHRTRVGKFRVEQAERLDKVTPADLLPLRSALLPMPMIPLNEAQMQQVREGRQLVIPAPKEERLVALLDTDGEVFSVARVEGAALQPECVIPSEVSHARD